MPATLWAVCILASACQAAAPVEVPEVVGKWWQVAENAPDVGQWSTGKQNACDFTIYRSTDGKWHCVACIRGTSHFGQRLLFRWEADRLTDTHWTPKGVFVVPRSGDPHAAKDGAETALQAPHCFVHDGRYHLFYNAGRDARCMISPDGRTWTPHTATAGGGVFFHMGRDLMVFHDEPNARWIAYYTGTAEVAGQKRGAMVARTAPSPEGPWSAADTPVRTSGNPESPFVVRRDGAYYLFQQTSVYRSSDPLDFDRGELVNHLTGIWYGGKYAPEIIRDGEDTYVAGYGRGIHVAKLQWVRKTPEQIAQWRTKWLAYLAEELRKRDEREKARRAATQPVKADEPEENAKMNDWLARPEQTEPKILQWAKQYPELVRLRSRRTFSGKTAYAVTVTDLKSAGPKRRMLVSQPHAHEPATTAGMMNFLSSLLAGADLAGKPAAFDRQRVLGRLELTFLPDGNPDGRSRAPVDAWDGVKYTNTEFLLVAFGRMPDGTRMPRMGRWSLDEHKPAEIGIVYERVSDREYVEPNRDPNSTYSRLVREVLSAGPVDRILSLHQTEFEKSDRNAEILLPFMQADLPEDIAKTNVAWGQAIIAAWKKMGQFPRPEPRPLKYGEDQLRYFRRCWSDVYKSRPMVTVEIQNNNTRTPPAVQRQLEEAAILASIEHLLQGE